MGDISIGMGFMVGGMGLSLRLGNFDFLYKKDNKNKINPKHKIEFRI